MQQKNQDSVPGFRGVDWRHAPPSARWWAINKDGEAFWFCAPDIAGATDFWFAEKLAASTFGYAGDYEESLTPRPV